MGELPLVASISMDPLLLAASFSGSPAALRALLGGEGGHPVVAVREDGVPTPAFLKLIEHGDGGAEGQEEDASYDVVSMATPSSLQTSNPVSPSLLDGVTTEGDTALHVVAANGDGAGYLRCASLIHGKARHLLHDKVNNNGDTALHCAARAGSPSMVSRLIALAGAGGDHGERLRRLVRTENGCGETALHEAVRVGNDHIVELLMAADPELACFPKDGGGTSPLYVAVLHDRPDIAQTMYDKSGGNLSYSGPHGQNALHAAALRGQAMTEILLEWNIGLTTQKDQNGSTPLHFATSILQPRGVHFWILCSWYTWFQSFWHSSMPFYPVLQVIFHPWFPWNHSVWHSGTPFDQVLQANPTPMYQPDDHGLFPIHIAASTGVNKAIVNFLDKCPNIAGVRDINGRTFLHVAVQKKKWSIAALACRTPSLSWILNMQDNEGNTALHLSVKLGHQNIFCLLLENPEVQLNLTNKNGETPLDLAQSKICAGYFIAWNPRFLINAALIYCHAKHGNRRLDHFEQQYIQVEDEEKESHKLMASTQTLSIGAVLMATVAFSANFTLPGDYSDNGTPNLSRRYTFDAFIIANSLAFGCSGIATINLMYSGTTIFDVRLRIQHFYVAVTFIKCSVTALATAFLLGLYVVLDPFAHMTSVAVCVGSSLLCVCGYIEPLRGQAVARALFRRIGNPALVISARILIIETVLVFWPLITSFIWAGISAKDRHKKMA